MCWLDANGMSALLTFPSTTSAGVPSLRRPNGTSNGNFNRTPNGTPGGGQYAGFNGPDESLGDVVESVDTSLESATDAEILAKLFMLAAKHAEDGAGGGKDKDKDTERDRDRDRDKGRDKGRSSDGAVPSVMRVAYLPLWSVGTDRIDPLDDEVAGQEGENDDQKSDVKTAGEGDQGDLGDVEGMNDLDDLLSILDTDTTIKKKPVPVPADPQNPLAEDPKGPEAVDEPPRTPLEFEALELSRLDSGSEKSKSQAAQAARLSEVVAAVGLTVRRTADAARALLRTSGLLATDPQGRGRRHRSHSAGVLHGYGVHGYGGDGEDSEEEEGLAGEFKSEQLRRYGNLRWDQGTYPSQPLPPPHVPFPTTSTTNLRTTTTTLSTSASPPPHPPTPQHTDHPFVGRRWPTRSAFNGSSDTIPGGVVVGWVRPERNHIDEQMLFHAVLDTGSGLPQHVVWDEAMMLLLHTQVVTPAPPKPERLPRSMTRTFRRREMRTKDDTSGGGGGGRGGGRGGGEADEVGGGFDGDGDDYDGDGGDGGDDGGDSDDDSFNSDYTETDSDYDGDSSTASGGSDNRFVVREYTPTTSYYFLLLPITPGVSCS